VLAVDGNSLGHRGFHSAREDPTAAGRPFTTGAVASMLASAWIHGPYAAVVVGFDHPVNRRKLDEPRYKAHRPDAHPDLDGHLQQLRVHLAACGFTVLEEEGAEADDLLAATADACEAQGRGCDVLSSDRDLTALVGPTTRLLRPKARFADLAVEDEAAVLRTYGVPPSAYVELAALRGDPSDGLDGAPGIGPKIAARLIRDHGSVAALYDALCDLPPRVEASLRAGRERVERNLVLMAPLPHLRVDLDAALAAGLDPERIEATLRGLDLDVAARRLARALSTTPPPLAPPPDAPDDLGAPDVAAVRATRAAVRAELAVTHAEQAALF
jgi:DNA polymerase-1